MASKRPHKTLTLAEKHNILQKLNSGVSGRALAKKYGIGTSTISDIKKNKDKIMGYIENCASTAAPMCRKSLRKPEYPEMENELYKWFKSEQERRVTVTTNTLKEKAVQICSKHYNDNKFNASRGWVDRFKKRCGITQLRDAREKLSSDSSAVQSPLRKFTEKMNELNLFPSQVYNAHESALFWKLLPDQSLDYATEPAQEQNTSKERLTFLACTNGDGTHKLKMCVIEKARNLNALKNCDNLPVEYYSTKNAWMTSTRFVKWFHNSFVMQVRQFQAQNNLDGKAILLVDNTLSESQLTSNDGQIITMFLPPDYTPLIQPIDQNVIYLTKMYYRKSLLVHVLSLEENVSRAVENITLKDAMFLLANSWEKLSRDSIEKCWKHILSYSADSNIVDQDDEEDSDNDIPLSIILKEEWPSVDEDRQEFTEIKDMLQKINAGDRQPKEEEISEWIAGDEDHLPLHSNDSSSEEELVKDESKVEHEEAVRCFSICVQWAEENGVDINSLATLRTLRQRAMEAKQGFQ